MAALRAEEEEEEEAEDGVENVVPSDQSTEETETKEGEGEQELDSPGSFDGEELAAEFATTEENGQSSNGGDADHADDDDDDDDKFAEEESSEANEEGVVENDVSSDQSTEEMDTKEGEGKQETNRMLPIVEQPKEIQKVEEEEEEDSVVLSEEEAAKSSNGRIQVVAAQTNVEISMRDSEEEEEAGDEESMVEPSVNVPEAATDQTSQSGLVDPSHDGGLSPAELVEEDTKFVNSEENKHIPLEMGGFGDELGGDSAMDVPVEVVVEDLAPAKEVSMEEENKQHSSNGEDTNDDSGGGDSAVEVPVQIEGFGDDEDVVASGLLVGEIAVEAATTTPVIIEPVPILSDDADNNNNNKENENENAERAEPGRKAKLENLSLRKLKAIYKDTLLHQINKNKGEEKKRSALQALDENCLSLK